MMMRGLRVASLFLAYSGLAWLGDYGAALLARSPDPDERVTVQEVRSVEVDVRIGDGGDCGFEVERELSIDLGGEGTLQIEAGAGGLRVEGREGLGEVVAVGRACASSAALLEELVLTAERVGDRLELSAHYPDGAGRRNRTARIDLVVSMPMGTDVDIDDSSGDMLVSGAGNVRIDDSSGSIVVDGALGSVSIEDSSGDIEVRGASGDVAISDGSGGIDVRDVAGSVAVRDGSGGIDVEGVGADVLIESDGSGGIEVRRVGGDFSVDRDGSGGIRFQDVAGRVDVPAQDGRRGQRGR